MAKESKEVMSAEDKIIKEFGEIIENADSLKDNPKTTIKVSPRIDLMLSGGVPEGSFVVLTGPPGLGKTALALQIAAMAQQSPLPKGEKRKVFYFDIEGRIKTRDLFGNVQLDTSMENLKLIKSYEKKILNGGEFLDIGERLIDNNRGCVFIFDSFSALCTEARYQADIKDRFRDDAPLMLSSFCKRVAQLVAVNNAIVIGITHRIANQGKGPSMWTEASGQKIQFQADIKLQGTHITPWKVGTDQIGQEIHWKCSKSALGPPGQDTSSFLRYNYGLDPYYEMALLAVDIGLIKKGGAWFTLENDKKLQGLEQVRNYLCEEEEFYLELKNKVNAIYEGNVS